MIAFFVLSHYLNQYWHSVDWTFGNRFLRNLKDWMQIQQFSYKKMNLRISSATYWPFCCGLNMLPLIKTHRCNLRCNPHQSAKCWPCFGTSVTCPAACCPGCRVCAWQKRSDWPRCGSARWPGRPGCPHFHKYCVGKRCPYGCACPCPDISWQ